MWYKNSLMSTDANIALKAPVSFTAGAIAEILRLMGQPNLLKGEDAVV